MENELLKNELILSKDQSTFLEYIRKEYNLSLPPEIINENINSHIWYLYEINIDNSYISHGNALFKCIICGDIMYNNLENVLNYLVSDNEKYKSKAITDVERLILYKEARKKYLSIYINYLVSCINNNEYIDQGYVYKLNKTNKYQ